LTPIKENSAPIIEYFLCLEKIVMLIDPMYILKNQLAPKQMNVLLQSIVHTQKVILMPIKKKSAPEKNSFYFPLKLFPISMLSPNPISLN
jgi:hypothetical protein